LLPWALVVGKRSLPPFVVALPPPPRQHGRQSSTGCPASTRAQEECHDAAAEVGAWVATSTGSPTISIINT
jgi:hypothetical protein